jgi:hypothetical protein
MSPRTVLIVSPHFPPSTLAGVHRARHLAKHLPTCGWRPIIVRVHERFYTEPGDPGLAVLVPADLRQVRTRALPADLCRLAGVGDIGLRAWPYLRGAVASTIAAERPSVVLITGSPFYPMLLAGWIRRRFALPVVLDFQDPWVSARGARRPWGSKAWASHGLGAALEPLALRAATFVTSVSETQNQEVARRHSWLDERAMAAIPVGGDPDDFAALRDQPLGGGEVVLDPAMINLSYVGTFLPRSGPLVERLFAAVAGLRRDSPKLAAFLRLNFVGTSNQPDGVGGSRVRPYAEAAGIADLVREHPRRVPYLEALSILANSAGLLLIGSDEPHYTASKIYPALLSGRPYVSLFHQDSSAHRILQAAGGGRAVAFASRSELNAMTPIIMESLRTLALTPEVLGTARHAAIEPYTARGVAWQFAEILRAVARP